MSIAKKNYIQMCAIGFSWEVRIIIWYDDHNLANNNGYMCNSVYQIDYVNHRMVAFHMILH